jgi:hypothetical protein
MSDIRILPRPSQLQEARDRSRRVTQAYAPMQANRPAAHSQPAASNAPRPQRTVQTGSAATRRHEHDQAASRDSGNGNALQSHDEADAGHYLLPSLYVHHERGNDQHSEQHFCHRLNETMSAADAGFDMMALCDRLVPLAGDAGIFEVIMPSGARLGVVVDKAGSSVRFLISAANAGFGQQLRRRRMELEDRLERRIGRSVTLAVL